MPSSRSSTVEGEHPCDLSWSFALAQSDEFEVQVAPWTPKVIDEVGSDGGPRPKCVDAGIRFVNKEVGVALNCVSKDRLLEGDHTTCEPVEMVGEVSR